RSSAAISDGTVMLSLSLRSGPPMRRSYHRWDQWLRRRPRTNGSGPLVVAGVGGGGAAPEVLGGESGDSRSTPVGARRTRTLSRAQRSAACWPSGALRRLASSSGTIRSHSSVPGATLVTAARQVSSRPPVVLLRTVTAACG